MDEARSVFRDGLPVGAIAMDGATLSSRIFRRMQLNVVPSFATRAA